ncbi:DUF5781 family protein [Halomicroarcula sp. S1AR25-4]|uniref:DUF5781 family protein n=1 Tax=unclassified Haloarcula TaxID=2624677 RepID=UPI00140F38CA|nr:DUF5781 family protein [Halomicroarcula sp. S1AR25-4]MDS0279480.1 DUF5781 family protein [Halomicroarcula sp. S1AR25-4]QIO21810.1 hypothetical protein G9465_05360 [Haloarcula sp. JP-L23]
MDVHVRSGPAEPFLSARDLFSTEYDLDRPVTVRVEADPDERTRVSHDDDSHRLTISRKAATSAMARELALHEFAHMHHYERGHPSHTQSTEEAIYLALAGRSVERRKLIHCYQIANHMKDVYADDVWMAMAPGDKLVGFLEASLAAAVADRPAEMRGWGSMAAPPRHRRASDAATRLTPAADPDITAVNAAFALALCERHGLVADGHRLYDLAHAAAHDAADVDLVEFKRHFESLAPDPDESEFRKALVDVTRAYASDESGRAAD